jgi:acylaminoacyl-peptidase
MRLTAFFRAAGLSTTLLLGSLGTTQATAAANATEALRTFSADDVFELEWASDPQVSPDGKHVAYVRRGFNRMKDNTNTTLWLVNVESGAQQPLLASGEMARSPLFSPDGSRLLYVVSTVDGPQMRVRWLATDRELNVAALEHSPSQMQWSADSTTIAFTLFTPSKPLSLVDAGPRKPEGAQWAEPVRVIDDMMFRFNGAGMLDKGSDHVYVVPALGGTPRAVTTGDNGFSSPTWSKDGKTLYVTGNDVPRPDLDPIESEIYAVDIASLARTAVTTRDGPDISPLVSPDGRLLAWRGFDDKIRAYQQPQLYVKNLDSGVTQRLTDDYDHAVSNVIWNAGSDGLFALATVEGRLELISIDLKGNTAVIADDVGGTSIGRPYSSGDIDVKGHGRNRVIAYTQTNPMRPAELAIKRGNNAAQIVTDLNSDLLGTIELANVEELRVPSHHDGLEIQAWVALPPGFQADGTAPLLLEIHGGPYAMYTPAFAAEIQRYAAEGYVTVWANPRGSTGYGEAFADKIDEAYPGYDYVDLMSVVDAVLKKGWADPQRQFITGGSGGGVLTAYATGKKPVINWFTMALSADIGMMVRRHWVRGDPWANPQKFFDLSPIAVVGNVTTPTLVMVGEEDWRTPAWEAEQWYTALKMQGVDTAYVRVPGAAHTIANRPSHLIAKTDNIMGWFKRYNPRMEQSSTHSGTVDTTEGN